MCIKIKVWKGVAEIVGAFGECSLTSHNIKPPIGEVFIPKTLITCQWVEYIKKDVNSQFSMLMCWKQVNWASIKIWAIFTRVKLWSLDNWVRASPKQQMFWGVSSMVWLVPTKSRPMKGKREPVTGWWEPKTHWCFKRSVWSDPPEEVL